MTVAEQIRKAALGPLPHWPSRRISWVGCGDGFDAVMAHQEVGELFPALSNTERRMFLLFVAEALGQMDPKSI